MIKNLYIGEYKMKFQIFIYRIVILFIIIIFCLNISHFSLNKKNFKCEKIYLTGNNLINDNELELSLKNYIDKSIFDIDLKRLRNLLSQYDLISDVKASIIFPNTISIEIFEIEPLAVVQFPNGNYIFDSRGEKIRTNISIPQFSKKHKIPYLKGNELIAKNINSETKFIELITFLKSAKFDYKNIYTEINNINFENNEIILSCNSKTKINLGDQLKKSKLQILNKFLNSMKINNILLEDYDYIKLENSKHLIVKERKNTSI